MPKGNEHTEEQIVSLLRQIEVATANEKMAPQDCRGNLHGRLSHQDVSWGPRFLPERSF